MTTAREHGGWALHESGPTDAEHTVLLLPGAFCTSAFYNDLFTEPKLAQAPLRLVAATPPGFGGRPPPDGLDLTVEGYADLAARLAADLGCDAVVGHSYFGNVAIEMAAAGRFPGPLVLLSPCFSSQDEERDVRLLDRVGRLPGIGRLAWAAIPRTLSLSMKGRLPPGRHDQLVSEMKTSDMLVFRALVRRYFEHLDRHGSLVQRLCAAGVNTWVVRGEHDEVGLTDDERRALEECPSVTMVTVPDAAHFLMTDQPTRIAELILEVVSADRAA
jgi:pimeloyl-ACP methyl ester carboxylesterase